MAQKFLSQVIRSSSYIRRPIAIQASLRYSTNTQSHEEDEEYADIVISGGGMVGAAMACALGNSTVLRNKKIVLLEAGPDQGEFILKEQYSNRTCALSPATAHFLEGFGAWQEIESMRLHPILRMQVWDSCSDSMITFNNSNMTESLAYLVENDVILAGIMKALKAMESRVDVRYNTRAVNAALPGNDDGVVSNLPFVHLNLNDGKVLKTKLVIGADGMNSRIRQDAGFQTIKRDYKQTGLVATLTLGDTLVNNTAWQRFLPTGPIALLPLSDTLSSLVWTTTTEHAEYLKQLPGESFVDALNNALWTDQDQNEIAGKALNILKSVLPTNSPDQARQLPPTVIDVKEGSRASFPLNLIHSTKYVRPRVALIGDAGHRIHPLAGQGVNLGFGDVVCLTKVLTNAVKNGADPGSLTHLLQYETGRQRHNVPVTIVIDALQRLYSTDFTPAVVLRSLGLHVTHSLTSLKRMIIGQASV